MAQRVRELRLPLEYRMAGPKRMLRDALLSVMLLSDPAMKFGKDPSVADLCERARVRTEMAAKVRELKADMLTEDIEHSTRVAGELFHWEVVSAARAAAVEPRQSEKRTKRKKRK